MEFLLKTASLTSEAFDIIVHQDTERPFSGEINSQNQAGTYLCRQCGLALFRSSHQFHSGCGWPSFDDEIKNTIARKKDTDGHRIEITCHRCNAHLGHEFKGEHLTAKNLRHCVNALSLDFVTDLQVLDTEEAIVAAGCFWGVDYFFKQLNGVVKTEVGYTGGSISHPNYSIVCAKQSGHVEAVRVVYDVNKINYLEVVKYFFEIHDPTQVNGQGPDIGEQYASKIFYFNEAQHEIAKKVVSQLEQKGLTIATRLEPVQIFWPAETEHQNYYEKHQQEPYCHRRVTRF